MKNQALHNVTQFPMSEGSAVEMKCSLIVKFSNIIQNFHKHLYYVSFVECSSKGLQTAG